MVIPVPPEDLRLESLEVGAAPLVRLFLERLGLPDLFARHLPPLPGRPPALPSATVLNVLLTNSLLARQPLYALAEWAGRRVPEHLGLEPGQAVLLNDDRVGRALDHLRKADRASLLTALVRQGLRRQHQRRSGTQRHLGLPAQPRRPQRLPLRGRQQAVHAGQQEPHRRPLLSPPLTGYRVRLSCSPSATSRPRRA